MKNLVLLGLLIVILPQFGCNRNAIEPISSVVVCKIAIETTFSTDTALNEGDTLFIQFPEGLKLNERDSLLNYFKRRYKFMISMSSLDSLTKKENISPNHPNLKNFLIGISRIQYKGRKTVVVESFKYKGMLGTANIETVFEYKEGHWICKGSKIISES
jgi:hypothetical protein